MKLSNKIITVISALGFVAATSIPALTQEFPNRPITLMVPYSPGGPADTSARLLADVMSKSIGQPVVIENKPGAATRVAAMLLKQAKPDGYTLMQCTSSTFLNTLLYKNSGYNVGDLTPISMISSNPFVFSVAKSVPVSSVKEFVAYAQKRPGELNFGSLGASSIEEMTARTFLKSQNLELVPIPFNGLAQAVQALMAGKIHMMFDAIGNATTQFRAGTINILGVATEDRVTALPNVPTLTEQGYPIVNGSWLGICAPAATPAPIIAKLGDEVRAAVASKIYQERISGFGSIPTASKSPDAFKEYIGEFISSWKAVVDDLGVVLE